MFGCLQSNRVPHSLIRLTNMPVLLLTKISFKSPCVQMTRTLSINTTCVQAQVRTNCQVLFGRVMRSRGLVVAMPVPRSASRLHRHSWTAPSASYSLGTQTSAPGRPLSRWELYCFLPVQFFLFPDAIERPRAWALTNHGVCWPRPPLEGPQWRPVRWPPRRPTGTKPVRPLCLRSPLPASV